MTRTIRYPRRRLLRGALRALVRMLLPLLADVRVSGRGNIPRRGPLIIVGNHTAAMEVVLMAVYPPRQVEFMGSIDVPHETFMARIIGLYGMIPVFRGNVSPSSMQAGVEVLSQGGVLGIFPEGGIWEPSIRRAQAGVAWLSYHAGAPVLPVGFGSMQGALKKLFALQRPTLIMNIGTPIPPAQVPPGTPRKQAFQDAADAIMDAVWDLIPAADRARAETTIRDESFDLRIAAQDADGRPVPVPSALRPLHGPAFSKFTHRRTLVANFVENFGLPVDALLRLADAPPAAQVLAAAQAILDHLEKDNPYYFTYRYGQAEGAAMQAGLREVHALAGWAQQHGLTLRITPIRRFVIIATGQQVELDRPEEFAKW